jgi:hypothetical protein
MFVLVLVPEEVDCWSQESAEILGDRVGQEGKF